MIDTKSFFHNCIILDHLVLRQLSHVKENWELTWDEDSEKYAPKKNSFARMLNELIEEIGHIKPPAKYHNNEDCLAEYVKAHLNWDIKKAEGQWVGSEYISILEQGGFNDIDQKNLISAAVGRIKAAIDRGQVHFDDMEQSHQKILADVLAVILYHKNNT